MAQKYLVNMLQTIGTTGLSQTTSNTIAANGNSLEFYQFASADAVRFYLDISAAGSSITFNLLERDPATGVFFTANPSPAGFWGVAQTGTVAGTVATIDPCYAEAYQVSWTVTGSFTCSLVGLLIDRSSP